MEGGVHTSWAKKIIKNLMNFVDKPLLSCTDIVSLLWRIYVESQNLRCFCRMKYPVKSNKF